MICHLFGDKPLPESMMYHCQFDPQEPPEVQWNTFNILIDEIAFQKVVCRICGDIDLASMFSMFQRDKTSDIVTNCFSAW